MLIFQKNVHLRHSFNKQNNELKFDKQQLDLLLLSVVWLLKGPLRVVKRIIK